MCEQSKARKFFFSPAVIAIVLVAAFAIVGVLYHGTWDRVFPAPETSCDVPNCTPHGLLTLDKLRLFYASQARLGQTDLYFAVREKPLFGRRFVLTGTVLNAEEYYPGAFAVRVETDVDFDPRERSFLGEHKNLSTHFEGEGHRMSLLSLKVGDTIEVECGFVKTDSMLRVKYPHLDYCVLLGGERAEGVVRPD